MPFILNIQRSVIKIYCFFLLIVVLEQCFVSLESKKGVSVFFFKSVNVLPSVIFQDIKLECIIIINALAIYILELFLRKLVKTQISLKEDKIFKDA